MSVIRVNPGTAQSFPLRLHFLRLMIGRNLPVLAKYKTDKPEHQQDGSGYHHPIPIFHRGEHAH
jgi:hypothetical protein